MKTSFFFRLSLLLLTFVALSSTTASAQKAIYSEGAQVAKSGYWTIETDLASRDYSLVRFYNAQDEPIYEERLNNVCLNPTPGAPLSRRTARMLGQVLLQVQQTQSASMVARNLRMKPRTQRLYAMHAERKDLSLR